MQRTQVQSLVEELSCHMLHNTAKREKKNKPFYLMIKSISTREKVALKSGVGRPWERGLLTPAEVASLPEPFWRTMQEYIPNALKIHRPTAPAVLLDKSHNKHGLHVFSKA